MALDENGNTHPRAPPPSNATLALRSEMLSRLFNSPSYFRSLAPSGSTCSFLVHWNSRADVAPLNSRCFRRLRGHQLPVFRVLLNPGPG